MPDWGVTGGRVIHPYDTGRAVCSSELEVPEVSLYSTTEFGIQTSRYSTIILLTFLMTLNVSDQQRAAAQVTARHTR